MTIPPPKIDSRTYQELVADTEQLAQQLSPWRPPADGSTDAGRALIRIFGRMATMVTDRLNRVPEKHFLSFLNLIGAQQHPPRAARVPLTASLVEESPVDALLPAHTQVAAIPVEGETEEVLFETEQDLVVVRSQLQAAIVHANNHFCDHIQTAASSTSDFAVFDVEQDTANTLYIAAEQLITQLDSQEIKLELPSNTSTENWQWSYWDGETWQALTGTTTGNELTLKVTHVSSDEWKPPQPKQLEGIDAQWLKLVVPEHLPELSSLRIIRSRIGEISPELASFNTDELDLKSDFSPLGEKPVVGDSLYLASQTLLSMGGAKLTVELERSDVYPFSQTVDGSQISSPQPEDVQIRWEAWNGQSWEQVAQAESLDLNGTVSIQLPEQVTSVEVNGEENYWLRARLVAGNYGSEPRFITTSTIDDSGSEQKVTTNLLQEKGTGFFPPSLKSIKLSWDDDVLVPPEKLLTALPSGAFVHLNSDANNIPGGSPSLYLRFDRPFPNQAIALYLQVAPPPAGALRASTPVTEPAKLTWEYSTAEGWKPLSVVDETQNLSQRGMVRFLGPADFAPQNAFGQSGYWLRLHWQAGDFQIPPRLQRVLTNTVWASQATTFYDEVLGGGTGDSGLVVTTFQTPVLRGQKLMVREPELPPAEEQEALRQQFGEAAIAIIPDEAGQPDEIWVNWQEVSDFYGSGSRDRHYTLDRMTGEIRFGGEGQGMPPPQGRNNIRLAFYQSGGGQQGNRAAETVTELKTTVPYVDRVTNHEPARGGADVESLAAVQESAPKRLRHRDRAVTWQDLKDITHAASSEVARVKVITPRFDPGGLQWLPLYHLTIPQAGTLQVEATIRDSAGWELKITLYGPGQAEPFQVISGTSSIGNPVRLEFEIRDEHLAWGELWRIQLEQVGESRSKPTTLQGNITLTTPVQTIQSEFELPPHRRTNTDLANSTLRNNPLLDIDDAGQAQLLIVPHSPALQPTPSLALVEQVHRYLKARLSPGLQLQITEPPWVKITVAAEVVPATSVAANGLSQAVEQALTEFLHPLTGGMSRRGWPFGRRPHNSDLYALLERMPGVGHVQSLTITSEPSLGDRNQDDGSISLLPEADLDRYLIYSGQHQITLATPPP